MVSDAEQTALTECEPTHQMRAIADRRQRLTGMLLFEIDLVGDEDLSVVDVNPAVSVSGGTDGETVYEDLLYERATHGTHPITNTRETVDWGRIERNEFHPLGE